MHVENARVRIVLAEGEQSRRGLLRFVLQGEGFTVVATATSGAELVRATEAERPDCVVVDEAIGVGAIAMAKAAAPGVPVVMVSQHPTSVTTVDGWVRLTDVLRTLGATVSEVSSTELAASGSETATPTYQRPEWVDRIRKDPATLREILASKTGAEARPSVTELQRRSARHRMHPSVAWRRDATPRPQPSAGRHPSTTAPASSPDRVVVVPDLPSTAEEDQPDHRRLGSFALGAAAVAGALVFGLTFGRGAPPVVWTAAGDVPMPTPVRADPPSTASADHRAGDARHPGRGSQAPGGAHPASPTGGTAGDPGPSGQTDQPHGPPAEAPGSSGVHNPHGGPPGLERANVGRASDHASVRAHPHKR